MRLLRLLLASVIVLLVMSVSNTAMAQTTITVGTGSASDYFYGPIYRSSASSSFDWSQYHYLYSAADLAAAGIVPGSTITSLAFQKNSTFVLTGTGDAFLDLYLKNGSTTALPASESWTNLTTGSTLVAAYTLNTTNNLPATTGWWTLTFTTPFVYTGGALELSVNWNCSAITGSPSDGAFNWLYATYAAGTSLGIASGSAITANLTDGSYGGTERPNTQFTYTAPACAGPTGLNATNILSSTADLGWNTSGSATGYNWKLVAAGAGAAGTAVASGTTTGTTASAAGLTPVTGYDLYVQSDCGGGTLSLYSGPYSFMTGCVNTLSGTYTVGGAGADFADIAAAVLELNTCGVSGPVTFNVAAGTYTGAVSIGQITGSSAANTVTFNGGSAATTTITHDGTGQYATIQLNGADYVTFQNLTIANTGATNGWGVHLLNGSDYNTVNNCVINVDAVATGSNIIGVLASNSATSNSTAGNNANYTTISNTIINGGYYGVRFNGNTSATADQTNNTVSNCTFNNIYGYAIYFYYQDNPIATGNIVNGTRATFGYGIYSTSSRHGVFTKNTLTGMKTYGIWLATVNATAQTPTQRTMVANNMVTALGSGDGIYLSAAINVDIFYNSATAENDQALWTNSTSTGYDIRNNIFVSTGTAAPIDLDAAPGAMDVLDYNIYYRSSTGNLADIATASYADLAAWKTADATKNANSLTGDPGFTSATNLHLVGAIADNVGTPIAGITTDIDGDARSATTPDIGADEYAAPSCAAPSVLTATNITTTSATLGWTAGGTETMWDVEYGATGFTQGTGTMVTGTMANPYMATALTPNTAYQFYVRANCGSATSPWIGPVSFFTGYCQFSSTNTASYFDAFTTTGGATNISNTSSGYATGGYQDATAMVVSQFATGSVNFTTTLVGTTVGVAIWVDWNNDLVFDVSERMYNTAAYVSAASGTITVPAGTPIGNYRMRAVMDYNATSPNACSPASTRAEAEDYTFAVIAAPSCLPPTTLAVSNTTATSTDLGWTENGTATAWNIEWGTVGFTQGAGTTVAATTNPYALTGLSPNTAYSFYVQADCGGGTTSTWAGPFTFTTSCVAFTVPYFEGFETGYTDNTAVAGCLSQESVVGTQVWTANNTLTTNNRAPYAGAWNAFLQWSNTDWLYIPIDLTGGTSYTFECYARQDGATATNSDVAVSYGTANNAAAMTNTIVAATGIINGAYQQITGSFTPTTTGTYYIGIKGFMNGTPWYISLDNISVITTPNCPAPNALTASNITATSADVTWAGTSAAYEVQYGAAGFTPGTGMTVTSTTTTASLTGLTFETNYNFYVRAVCAPGDTSPWSGAGSFFTGYCTPAPTSVDLQGITNVSMGGVNNTTVAEPGNYGNYSAQVANAPQGGTLAIDVTYQTGFTYDTWAWVDWNNDLDFTDAGEEYYLGNSTTANPTTLSGSITIPATALGNYRIRIGGADTGLPLSPANPCYNGLYAAFEDYTLNVMPALEPFALLAPANNAYVLVAGPAQNPIDISWESAGSVAAMYEWRANITGGSLNTPAVTLPADNMGMDTTLSLNVQAVDALLASFGVAIGDTAVLDWSVVAYSATGDSLFATTPYTVNLVRLGVSSPLLLNAPQNTNSTTGLRAPNGSTSHTYMRAATVVLPTEFATAGIAANTTIRNFGFNVNGTIPAGAVTGVFKLYLQNTTDVTYGKGTAWAGITPGMTEVFNDTITINGGGAGWDVVLDTLFAYAGNSVYVAYDWELVANPLATAISYMANTALASGLVSASSATVPPVTLAGSSFRPEFSWGIDRDADDLEVVALYAMGKNPLGYSQAEQVQAIVRNNGYLPADKTVTLNITGANPYTTSENVTLAPGQETTVSFMAYNPTTVGLNTMTVSVPADQVALNDTKSWVQETTTNTFAYADTVLTGLGGVGYNTGSGLLMNRYYVNGAASISEIKVRISDNAATAGNAVYAVLMDTSGAIVAQSAPYTVTAADLGTVVTFTLGTTVNVADVDVFVGLAQPANATTGYFPVAYQGETPTRPNAYYTADITGAGIGTVNGFRLMIEAVVGPACTATSSVAVTNANCFGDASGEITVTVTGGTGNYTYNWSNGQTNATATGLVAAIYDVTITDANGCSLVATGTVGQPSAIVLTTSSVSDTSSAGVGTASVVATGGTSPYTYAWSDGQTADVATGLTPGTYTVTITDANNCTATETVIVDDYTSTTRIDYVTNVSIYPNPTSGNTVIDLELSQNADVAVSIYTVTGVLVQDFGKENTSKATHMIDVTEYPAGMYLVRFVVDNQVITKKLLVTK